MDDSARWKRFLVRCENQHVTTVWDSLCRLMDGPPLPVAMGFGDDVSLCWNTPVLHLDASVARNGDVEWFFMNHQTSDIGSAQTSSADLTEAAELIRLVLTEVGIADVGVVGFDR